MNTSIHRFRSFFCLASLLGLSALAGTEARALDKKFNYQSHPDATLSAEEYGRLGFAASATRLPALQLARVKLTAAVRQMLSTSAGTSAPALTGASIGQGSGIQMSLAFVSDLASTHSLLDARRVSLRNGA